MAFEEKLSAARQQLEALGVASGTAAPPLHRLLWALGIHMPPPHFAGFGANFALMGGWFGTLFGLFAWFFFLRKGNYPTYFPFFFAALTGSLFGIAMAFYYYESARKLRLPNWRQFTGRP
jgi:hypothetical protein